MVQAKFSIEDSDLKFLNQHRTFGFTNKSAVVRAALDRFQEELENKKLELSAELYAKIYDTDKELQELTVSAITPWRE